MCPSDRSVRLEASEFRSAFDVLDADQDGRISRDDLKAFYSAFPSATTDDKIHSMISAADADLDDFFEFHEFERILDAAKPAAWSGSSRKGSRSWIATAMAG
ncbi:hypothetical protein J5N97_022309 [Dioscorea zingiberensis]|uniref:EF-hand domain-containing protein n=1 Tax=Dioscorea zingiberensis TaxID=325984 RepID=A0A9D5CBA5_9LILI|nr:hypothetical protein J5N97_022309 [Dioscorea zingiberensis]